jgi:hypothetical protein
MTSTTFCPFGGVCHTCPPHVQAKLTVGEPDNKYEREADRVADLVMRMPEPGCPECEEEETLQTRPVASQITPLVQRQVEEEEEEEEPIQAKQTGGQTLQVSPGLGEQIRSLRGGGRPLPQSTRNFYELRFGYDFSQVRVYSGSKAAETAREVNAQAFTIGQNVVFGAGHYAPDTASGKRLLAHELTHVLQQSPTNHNTPITKTILREPFFRESPLQINRISPQSGSLTNLQRQVQVHVNLHRPQGVKLWRREESDLVYTVSAGTATAALISRAPYQIEVRRDTARVGSWGLQYFSIFNRDRQIGFHSNECYPLRSTLCNEGRELRSRGRRGSRVRNLLGYCTPPSRLNDRDRWILIVDGTPRSHGCVRMQHSDAQELYNETSIGTQVYVYDSAHWLLPKWPRPGKETR